MTRTVTRTVNLTQLGHVARTVLRRATWTDSDSESGRDSQSKCDSESDSESDPFALSPPSPFTMECLASSPLLSLSMPLCVLYMYAESDQYLACDSDRDPDVITHYPESGSESDPESDSESDSETNADAGRASTCRRSR